MAGPDRLARPGFLEHLRLAARVEDLAWTIEHLWPPGALGGRVAIGDFSVLGHVVPGGSIVLYSPYLTHRLPEVWGDPERFRPERWEDGEPVPFSFVPFGGGYRKCIGFALATLAPHGGVPVTVG